MESHNQAHNHQVLVHHDRNGSDIEMPIADAEKSFESHNGSGDEKAMNVTVDPEHKGEFTEEQAPKQNNKQKFRRFIRKWKPVIHVFIWMLVTTQVSSSSSPFKNANKMSGGGSLALFTIGMIIIGLSRCCCGCLSPFASSLSTSQLITLWCTFTSRKLQTTNTNISSGPSNLAGDME
jgi:hypothetical protein